MSTDTFTKFLRRYQNHLAILIVVLLFVKFFFPLLRFEVPLGFDPGIYRYLFLQYAEAFSHFQLPDLLPWAKEHPPGLFLFSTALLQFGLPVDALIGWVWNAVPVTLVLCLSWVVQKKYGTATGLSILFVALISQAYFDAFTGMYYKAFVSLIFLIFAYHHFERKSYWAFPLAFLCLVTHHQTGLILILSMGCFWAINIRNNYRNTYFRIMTVAFALIAILLLAVYGQSWERSFWSPFKSIFLLRGDNAPGGAFPDALFYIRTMGILLALGIFGFLHSFKRERFSLWQLSVLWCAIFIVFRLVFYRRFFFQLDFFLLPFSASALVIIWNTWKEQLPRAFIMLLMVAQTIVSFQAMQLRAPLFTAVELDILKALPVYIETDATVIALENRTGTWLRGWLPNHSVGAPGLFDTPPWNEQDWEKVLYGTPVVRRPFLDTLPPHTYFVTSSFFHEYYGEHVSGFLSDPCLRPVPGTSLLKVVCFEN